ncbi:hypothetical protein F7725_021857 [Dissostichus mawsoni]|uniref:Uncharacterized protein n=1 Tax=Dissostichus mawsoni TaxID=36200 RepID=A0A7J5ZGG6_DISMA|nr:hypothetical protein F7725_021857 [Dissostichus mawsoni]
MTSVPVSLVLQFSRQRTVDWDAMKLIITQTRCHGGAALRLYAGLLFLRQATVKVRQHGVSRSYTVWQSDVGPQRTHSSPGGGRADPGLHCRPGQGGEAVLLSRSHIDAATRVTASVSRPLASHVPVEKICQRLSSTDMQICELRYDPQVKDLSSDGLKIMKVLELRNILASWGEECRGCLEKHEFVSLIQEKALLHAHISMLGLLRCRLAVQSRARRSRPRAIEQDSQNAEALSDQEVYLEMLPQITGQGWAVWSLTCEELQGPEVSHVFEQVEKVLHS